MTRHSATASTPNTKSPTSLASNPPYIASPTKRRSKGEIERIKAAIREVLLVENPATVRGVFYQVAALGLIRKTESDYQQTIIRLLSDMRREGQIPWNWIADNTRTRRKPPSFSGIASAVERTAQTYRRAMWESQPRYVEVWCEKDTLTGVLYGETAGFDIPLMTCRGYPSLTFLQSSAQVIAEQGKPTDVLYIGDHDPSGRDIPRFVERELRAFAPRAEITFTRLAVTETQIAEWSLPSRPTKRSDGRSRGWVGDSVDADAIPPRKLRELLRAAIESRIDQRAWDTIKKAEASERDYLKVFAKSAEEGGVA